MLLKLITLAGNKDIGEKYRTVFRQYPVRAFSANTSSTIDVEHLNFGLVRNAPMGVTKAIPRNFGFDFDSGPFHLYFMASAPSVEPYPLPARRFVSVEGVMTTLYQIQEPDIQRLVGDDSVYGRYMAEARKKINRYVDAGITRPRLSAGVLCRSVMELTAMGAVDVQSCRVGLRGGHQEHYLLERIQDVTFNIRQVDSILRVLRRAALDLCAFIGGVRLPSWPASPELAGVVVYSSEASNYTPQQTEEISLLERWGVPVWLVERDEKNFRYELNATARPEWTQDKTVSQEKLQQAQLRSEALHQEKLAHAVSIGVPIKDAYIFERVISAKPPGQILDGDEFEKRLDSLLLAALAPESNMEAISFDCFSEKMGELLGAEFWTRELYEPHIHGQVEGRKWHCSRRYPFLTRNFTALSSRLTIPPHYHNPTLFFPNKDGSIPGPPPNLPTIPKDLWHCLELRYFDNLSAIGELRQFQASILAYRIIRTTQSATDGGFSKGIKPYVLQLWGKEKSKLEEVAQRLPSRLQGKVISELQSSDHLLPFHWTHFVNSEYISLVLAAPRSSDVRAELLKRVPTLPPPCADDVNYRPLKVKYIHFLRQEILGGTRFKPSTRPGVEPTPALPMTRFDFTTNFLRNLAFQPRPRSLTYWGFIELQRLEIILDMLSHVGVSFRLQLVPNDGPFSSIFSLISEHVWAESHRPGSNSNDCKCSPVTNSTPRRMEGIAWDDKAQIFSLFLIGERSQLRPLNKNEVRAWIDGEEKALDSELAKKKHQPRSSQSSSALPS
jgi:hypothetical protein